MKKMAYLDTAGKIHNAEKGTLTYYHEEGHLKWFKEGKEQIMQIYQFLFIMVSICLLARNEDWFIRIIVVIPITLFLISEIHAWIFAYIKEWKGQKNDRYSNLPR